MVVVVVVGGDGGFGGSGVNIGSTNCGGTS
jgi:hypothetical protein